MASEDQKEHDVSTLREQDESENASYVCLGERDPRWVISGEVAGILYRHQREGIRWLWGLQKRGQGEPTRFPVGFMCKRAESYRLCHVFQGLGKTLQVASFLVGLLNGGVIRSAIIIAPATLLGQWEKELERCGAGKKVKRFHGQGRHEREKALCEMKEEGGIMVTTYGMLTHNADKLCPGSEEAKEEADAKTVQEERDNGNLAFEWIVCDEGHRLKNPSTKIARCVRGVRAGHRLLLTGTPVQNNLMEMWALFDLTNPGLLGEKREFRAEYERVITKGQSREASDRERRVGAATSKALRRRISPFFLRREKMDVLAGHHENGEAPTESLEHLQSSASTESNLSRQLVDAEKRTSSHSSSTSAGPSVPPPKCPQKLGRKNDIIVWLKTRRAQRKLYLAFLQSPSVHAALNKAGSALSALTVLKKVCDHPSLVSDRANAEVQRAPDQESLASLRELTSPDSTEAKGSSCKVDFVLALLREFTANGNRTLLFSQSKEMLDIVEEALVNEHIGLLRIDGSFSTEERQRRVERFQTSKDIPVFLLTSHVGGLGLTLTEANRVVILDPAWNPSTDNQSVDRVYRIGQAKDVVVYRLITCGTVEEKIYRKQVFKGALSKAGTEESDAFRYFTHDQLTSLFSTDESAFDRSETQRQLEELHGNERDYTEEIKNELNFVSGCPLVAGFSDHDLLFSRPDNTATGPGTSFDTGTPHDIPSPGSSPGGAKSKQGGKKPPAPPAAWSGPAPGGNGVANILSNAVRKYVGKAKLSLAKTQAKPGSTEQSEDNRQHETGDRGEHVDEGGQKDHVKTELEKVRATLASTRIVENLPDKGEKLRAREVELRSKFTAESSAEPPTGDKENREGRMPSSGQVHCCDGSAPSSADELANALSGLNVRDK